MPIPHPVQPLDQLAQKWRDLADRRREHFIELSRTGRWRRYYTEEQFLAQMREVARAADAWAQLADPREAVAHAE